MHPHSLERSNGQTDAKRRFRSTNLHTFTQTHTWTSTHTTIHTHIPFENYFLISQLLQVSHDLIYFGPYIVIYCYKFSRNHAAQKQKHIYMVTWFNKGVMAMQQIKDDFFLIINGARSIAYPYGEKKWTLTLTLCTHKNRFQMNERLKYEK